MGAWGSHRKGDFLPFEEARAAVRAIKLGSCEGWREWSKAGGRPSNIPSSPSEVYRDDGWISWPDWVGYEKKTVPFLTFAAARAIMRKVNLGSDKAWRAWSKAGQRPSNIPDNPDRTYRDDGWISTADWLGYKVKDSPFLAFAAARAIMRKLKLGSNREWAAWSKAGGRPSNIPSLPSKVYRDDGWISLPDWLGYETPRTSRGHMLPFAAARAVAQKLNLRSGTEWQAWSKAGQRPSNIPSHPDRTYLDDCWISWPDWLGYEEKGMTKGGSGALPFEEARDFARTLKLGSYTRSGKSTARVAIAPSTFRAISRARRTAVP